MFQRNSSEVVRECWFPVLFLLDNPETYLADATSWALWSPSSKSVWMTRILRLAGFIKQELEEKGN